jgi:hypothetical protein
MHDCPRTTIALSRAYCSSQAANGGESTAAAGDTPAAVGTVVVGSNSPVYTPTAADFGQQLRVRVTPVDARGTRGRTCAYVVPDVSC